MRSSKYEGLLDIINIYIWLLVVLVEFVSLMHVPLPKSVKHSQLRTTDSTSSSMI
jgi:hypothetical protein